MIGSIHESLIGRSKHLDESLRRAGPPIGHPTDRGASGSKPRESSAARAEIWTMMRLGGFDQALVRAVLFVLARERPSDGRLGAALQDLAGRLLHLSPGTFERIVCDQAAVLQLDGEVAIESLPALLPDDPRAGTKLLKLVGAVVTPTVGDLAVSSRLERLARIVCFADDISRLAESRTPKS